jgi:hypothetical protein
LKFPSSPSWHTGTKNQGRFFSSTQRLLASVQRKAFFQRSAGSPLLSAQRFLSLQLGTDNLQLLFPKDGFMVLDEGPRTFFPSLSSPLRPVIGGRYRQSSQGTKKWGQTRSIPPSFGI